MGNTCCCSCSALDQVDYQDIFDKVIEVEDMTHIDELVSFIEQLLTPIDQGNLQSIAHLAKSNRVTASLNSSDGLLEKILKRSKHVCKRDIVPTLNRETRKLVIDVTNQGAQIMWVGVALSVVGFVLERIEQVSSNREECIVLLKYMFNLAKYIKQLEDHLANRGKLKRVLQFIVEGSLLCISQMQSHPLSKFFAAPVTADDLQKLRRGLGQEYAELTMEAIIVVLDRIPVVLPPSQGRTPQAVGIEEATDSVIELLDMKVQSLKTVVIYGQGGIGKTTLAETVFSKLNLQNYKYCKVYLEQNCSEADLKVAQQQILKDLYDKNIALRSLNEGQEQLSKYFKEPSSKPAFIFVDNALKQSDLEKLLPISDLASLPPQSRILLTTRNLSETRRLSQPGVELCHYQVACLPQDKAREILCELALDSADACFNPTIDINGLLEICQGIPLVLTMAGPKLREHAQNVADCRERVEYLKRLLLGGEEGELSERMVGFVYDRLDASCKEAFLDIVFFYCNWKRQRVVSSVGATEFEELQSAALVNVTNEGKVNVHDIVKARGRMLSRDGERITDLQSLTDALQDEESIKKIKGIALNESFELEAHQLNKMKRSLRVLSLTGNTRIINGECRGAFENLRLLSIENHNNYSWMDVSKHPRLSAIILRNRKDCYGPYTDSEDSEDPDIDSEDSNVPEFAATIPSSLRYLYIEGVRLTNFFTTLKQVQSLNCLTLQHCSGFNSLPDRFGSLSSLGHLDLSSCSSLGSLPDSFGSLSSLGHLDLRSCSSLGSLPDSFGSLSSLGLLGLSSCSSLGSLPDSFGSLYKLVKLYLVECTQLSLLPESFVNLASLKHLKLQDCEKLTSLPQNFGQLKYLEYVSMQGCSAIQSLSGDFECLSSLTAVKASECSQLEENTIDTLAKMKGLMVVDIDKSPKLKERWEQVKEHYSLAVVECGRQRWSGEIYPDADVMSRAFFHSESKFVHVDENGQLGEWPSPAGGVKQWVLVKDRDVTSSASSNSRCWEAVKKKWMEVVAWEGGQMIFVDVGGSWEERERRIEEALPHLPSGTAAWMPPDNRARLLFTYSVQRCYKRHIVEEKDDLGVGNCIVSTSVWADEEGRRRLDLDHLQFILPDFGTLPLAESEHEDISDQLLSPVLEAIKFLQTEYDEYD